MSREFCVHGLVCRVLLPILLVFTACLARVLVYRVSGLGLLVSTDFLSRVLCPELSYAECVCVCVFARVLGSVYFVFVACVDLSVCLHVCECQCVVCMCMSMCQCVRIYLHAYVSVRLRACV